YVKQFTMRVRENINKTDRILDIYKNDVLDPPGEMTEVLSLQKERLLKVQKRLGDYVSPFDL
ncbi:MAG: hypothetical protein KAR18_03100, partial [Spirochaetes bacterium]|nr:hypothetical protein [Spirochaetota bacterium]